MVPLILLVEPPWQAPADTLRAPHGRRKRHSPNFLRGWTAANTGSSNTNTRRAGRPRDRQRGQRVSNDSSSVFLLLGGVRRPVTRVAGVCLLCCFCVLASEVVGAGGTGQRERAAA